MSADRERALELKRRDDARGVHEPLQHYLAPPAPPPPPVPPEQLDLFGIDISTGQRPLISTGQPPEAAGMGCPTQVCVSTAAPTCAPGLPPPPGLMASLDAQLAAAGPAAGFPAPPPTLHRRAVLPSVRAAQEAAARREVLLADLRLVVDRAGLDAEERHVAHVLEGELLEDARPWLALLVDACQVEVIADPEAPKTSAILKAALRRGRAVGVGMLARSRFFFDLRELHEAGKAPTATLPQVARVWGLPHHATVMYGVDAHRRRTYRAQVAAVAPAETPTERAREAFERALEQNTPTPPAPASSSRSSSALPPPTRWVDRDTDPPPPDEGELPAAPHARSA